MTISEDDLRWYAEWVDQMELTAAISGSSARELRRLITACREQKSELESMDSLLAGEEIDELVALNKSLRSQLAEANLALAEVREELKRATGCICGEDHYPDGED